LGLHPLVDLAGDKEVKKAAGFRAAAAELTGANLAPRYQTEIANAPRRHAAGRRYFVAYNSRLAGSRKPARDDEHLSLAVVEHCRRTGSPLVLPEEDGSVDFVHAQIPLKSAAEDRSKGESDPNRGLGKLDLLGIGPGDRLVIGQVKYLPPEAARGRTGDTPLRALLMGLANAAIASANHEALREEIAETVGRSVVEGPPLLLLIGSPRYWELCRRREAQKGAAWIKELERLAREIEEEIGVSVRYLACRLEGDPGWSYPEGSPVLDDKPHFTRAWEHGAGKLRPKPKSKPKALDPSDLPVEPDLSRPVRSYGLAETYSSGDRIQHPTLGLGVVQGIAGNGKISVLFGDKKSLLVHARGGADAPTSPAPQAPPASRSTD